MPNLVYMNLVAEKGIYCKHELSRYTFLDAILKIERRLTHA